MPYDASDRKSVRRAEKAARQSDRSRQAVITNLMSTTQGREWLWGLLESCHIFAQTFTSDPLATAFAEGRRNIGLSILGDIMFACPDQYITAAREANVRHNSNDRSASAELTGSEDASGGVEGSSSADDEPRPTAERYDDPDDFKGIYNS